jgi:hypothetical protein
MRAVFVLTLVLTFSILAFGGSSGNCAQIDDSSRPDCTGAIAFFARLQNALKNDNRQAIASMVNYPLRTTLHHKNIRIRDRRELLSHFNEIFDSGVRCAISNSTDEDVWGNWQGFTIRRGEVWFDAIIPSGAHPDVKAPDYWMKYPFAIITVNNAADGEPCKKR